MFEEVYKSGYKKYIVLHVLVSVNGANNLFGRNCQYYVEGICKRTGIDVLDLFLSLSFVW